MDDMEAWLPEAIDGATEEMLVAVQELSLPRIAQALIAAQQRGIRVAVVMENNYRQAWSEQRPSRLNPRDRQRCHQLNRLADSDRDGTTTTNEDFHGDAGRPSSCGNVNHLLRINSPELALVIRQEFAQMWGDGCGGKRDSRFGLQKAKESVQVGDIRMDVLFLPHPKRDRNHGLHLLEKQLRAAKESIDMALFMFSAQRLTNVLREQIKRGIGIRLVADPDFASRPFSAVLDLLGVSLPDHTCKVEAGNQPLDQALKGVGSPRLAHGDKLHHQFAVIYNKTVITGSFNWSTSAAHTKDETLLAIHSPQLAQHFTREMDRLWDRWLALLI